MPQVCPDSSSGPAKFCNAAVHMRPPQQPRCLQQARAQLPCSCCSDVQAAVAQLRHASNHTACPYAVLELLPPAGARLPPPGLDVIYVITSRPCLLVVAVLLLELLAPPALAVAMINLLLHAAVCSTN